LLRVDTERRLFSFRVNPLRMNPALTGRVWAPSKYQFLSYVPQIIFVPNSK